MEKQYNFPVKIIRQLILKEFESKKSKVAEDSTTFKSDSELSMICYRHIKEIRKLDTYEKINFFLLDYRGLSLQEWIDTL